MDVLLIKPNKGYFLGADTFFPMGLMYLAVATSRAGYDVHIADCDKNGWTLNDLSNFIKENNPQCIGINMFSNYLLVARDYLNMIKEVAPEIKTIVGGPHPSAAPKQTMNYLKNADYAMVGEGEVGFPMIVNHILKGAHKLEEIPGLIWRKDNEIMVNPQTFTNDLDRFHPDIWNFINMTEYQKKGYNVGLDTAAVFSTRGCPFDCTFCSANTIVGKKFRVRSLDNIISELRYLKDHYNVKNVILPDDNFTLNRNFVKSFCESILRENLHFKFLFTNGIRLDSLDEEILSLMLKAGIHKSVAIGVESGSDKILKLMKKSLSVAEIREKVLLMKKSGFRPIGYFIIGFPGETKETIMETINLSLELPFYRAQFNTYKPYPGCPSYKDLVKSGEIDEDTYDFDSLRTDLIPYVPKGMTLDEIRELRNSAFWRFNLRLRIIFEYLKDFNTFKFAISRLLTFLKVNYFSNSQNP